MTVQEIIFDLGSTWTKIGIPDDTPERTFPTVVGYPRSQRDKITSSEIKNVFVGDEALSKVGIQQLEFPINRGIISNWQYIEKVVWHAIYNEIRSDPADIGLMILEHPATPSTNRNKLAELLFGEIGLPLMCYVNPATSAMAAYGGRTGVVLCSGGQTTYSMAVKDGKGIISSLVTLDIGRQDIIESFAKSLTESGRGSYVSYGQRNELNSIIDKHGYIPLDYDEEMKKTNEEIDFSYELADGQIWHFHHDVFKHNEILFKPELYGLERDGIHKMVHTTIQKCDPSIHNELYQNLVLSGGNTNLPGIVPRLTKELQLLAPKNTTVRFRKDLPAERVFCSFKGASYLQMMPYWRNHLWITRHEYDESGVGNIIEKLHPLGFN